MTDFPWSSEHPLDAERVAAIVGGQFRDLDGASVRYLDEGWDSVVYEVAGDWMFRFPKRRAVEQAHEVEMALLPRLGPLLPIAIPHPLRRSEPTAEYPFRALGYRRLPGVPAIDLPLDAVDVAASGARLGAFLAALHAFPVAEARALGVPEPARSGAFERWRGGTRERFSRMAPALPPALAARARAFLDQDLPRELEAGPRLVHYDLGDAHVLVDVEARGISGIVDWGDACIGDPAMDFAGLAQWLGAPLVEAALRAYAGVAADEALRARTWAAAAFASFSCLWYGIEAARPAYVRSGVRSLAHTLPTSKSQAD